MTPEAHRRLRLAAGLVFSLAIVGWFAAKIDWPSFLREFHRVRLALVPVLIVFLLATFWIRAARWRYLLPDGRRLGLRPLTEACLVGAFATFILPLRAGEFVRPWALSRWQPVGFPAALASIVVERIFDALSVLSLFAVCLMITPDMPAYIVAGARMLGVLALVLAAGAVVCYVRPQWILGAARATLRRLPASRQETAHKVESALDNLVAGFRAIATPGDLLRVIGWSAALWLGMAAWYQVGLWAFGEHPSVAIGLLLNVMIALAVAAPSAPGFVGTYQAGCYVALTVLGTFTKEFGLAYSVVTHAIQFLTILVGGAIVLQVRGLRLGQARECAVPGTTPP